MRAGLTDEIHGRTYGQHHNPQRVAGLPCQAPLRPLKIDTKRRIVIGDGVIVVALFVESGASIVEGHRQFGIEPDRLIQVGHGAVVVTLFVIGGRSIGVESRQI